MFLIFSHSTLQAKVVCTNESLTYVEDLKSFGIPRIPIGTPMGSKSLTYRDEVLAHKNFTVTDPNNWTNYQDWNLSLILKNKKIVWVNPNYRYEHFLTADLTIVDDTGAEVVSNEKVNCLVSELLMPFSDF